ncbi:MAG: hypothetical protein MPK62_13220 [Alphaproteobacteria bacterium]|nr:hypothetical protein [Alphaproteobacteria bacterium]
MEDLQKSNTLRANLSAAAHLIHGSSEAKFNITYCPGNAISEAVIRQVGFNYMPFDKAVNTFNLASLRDGHNQVKGEGDIFYVSNPALGLWALRKQFNNLMHNL